MYIYTYIYVYIYIYIHIYIYIYAWAAHSKILSQWVWSRVRHANSRQSVGSSFHFPCTQSTSSHQPASVLNQLYWVTCLCF